MQPPGLHTLQPMNRIHHLFDQRAAQAPDHPFLLLQDGVIT